MQVCNFSSPLKLKQPVIEREREGEKKKMENCFLEELLAPRRDNNWAHTFPSGFGEFLPNGWSFDSFDETPASLASPNPDSFVGFSEPTSFDCPFSEYQPYPNFIDGLTVTAVPVPVPEMHSSAFPQQVDYTSMVDDEELGLLSADHQQSFEDRNSDGCKLEVEQSSNVNQQVFSMGFCGEKKAKSRNLNGQPSKNLMAERRRRKRLNDRLSMLRSIVPKISKMDRTSILGDTIDYMKELLERINKLQEEETEMSSNKVSLIGNLKDLKERPNEVMVRNSPKFEVERRDSDTRIDICCAAKPGLLLSTVTTLEALGIEIQQCVISCFNDFSLQASCSEVAEQKTLISSEDIKQELFRKAGYGGRCL